MRKKEKRSQKKYSRNVKERSNLFRLMYEIFRKAFPNIPNIRLRLHLKEEMLGATRCKELQRVLKLEQDLTDTNVRVDYKFHRYRWEIRVKNPTTFKRALATYQKKNPDIESFLRT